MKIKSKLISKSSVAPVVSRSVAQGGPYSSLEDLIEDYDFNVFDSCTDDGNAANDFECLVGDAKKYGFYDKDRLTSILEHLKNQYPGPAWNSISLSSMISKSGGPGSGRKPKVQVFEGSPGGGFPDDAPVPKEVEMLFDKRYEQEAMEYCEEEFEEDEGYEDPDPIFTYSEAIEEAGGYVLIFDHLPTDAEIDDNCPSGIDYWHIEPYKLPDGYYAVAGVSGV